MGKGVNMTPRLRTLHVGAPARILFISDLHLRRQSPEMTQKTLSVCKNTRPDIVILGGDMAEYDEGLVSALDAFAEAFKGAKLFAVPGNNDDELFEGDRARQKQIYRERGVDYLLNEVRRISVGEAQIEIAGCEDAYSHTPAPNGLFSYEKGVYRVLVCHEPLKCLEGHGSNLLLSGHTHGGQINILGVTCYTLLPYEKRLKYICLAGKHIKNGCVTLVSRGIGYSKFPVRIGADSEILLIE